MANDRAAFLVGSGLRSILEVDRMKLRTLDTMAEAATFVFGNHELDRARFELRRDNARVVVQPKALRLLFYLVAHCERAVSSDELLAQLWPGETVTRGSLKRAVLAARRALAEVGEAQSSIRTVRGHGYQFVRPVRVIVSQGAGVSAAVLHAPALC